MKIIRNNIKVIIAVILGIILVGGIAYAAGISASEVSYSTNKNGEIRTVAQALNDLYENKKMNILDDLYPYQKFVITKDINGYVFTLKVYDSLNNQIYTTTYNCDIWGVFDSTTKTYTYNNKTYTLTANGGSGQNNFRGELYCDGYHLYTIQGYSSGDNGSWDTNTTVEMNQIIKFQGNLYNKK